MAYHITEEQKRRTVKAAYHVLNTRQTIRETAKTLSISKTCVHLDLTKRLPEIDPLLYKVIREILDEHLNERSIRGAAAVKAKWTVKRWEREYQKDLK